MQDLKQGLAFLNWIINAEKATKDTTQKLGVGNTKHRG
jgi:hypothetical protein